VSALDNCREEGRGEGGRGGGGLMMCVRCCCCRPGLPGELVVCAMRSVGALAVRRLSMVGH
jgi:hypothetical protein